jgi:hypothetical protein
MTEKPFADTNIFLYAKFNDGSLKHKIAFELLKKEIIERAHRWEHLWLPPGAGCGRPPVHRLLWAVQATAKELRWCELLL